jgi:hypothetical protein
MKLKTLPPLFKAPTPLVTPSSALPKVTEPYYLTAEHKAWAADVKARSGGVCAHCGKATPRLIADHIVEVRDGGAKTDPANGDGSLLVLPRQDRRPAPRPQPRPIVTHLQHNPRGG